MLAANSAAHVFDDPDGAAVVSIGRQTYRLPGASAERIVALLSPARSGIGQADLIELGSKGSDRLSVLQTIRALIGIGALTVHEELSAAAERAPAPSLAEFEVLPRHCGTWEGKWVVCDTEGNVTERFDATLVSKILGNEWVNELEQRHADGTVEQQRFVGEVVGPGLLRLRSMTPQMCAFDLLLREVAGSFLLVQILEKASRRLRAVEVVTLVSPYLRLRTMQSFAADGSFQGTMNIVERLVGQGGSQLP